MHEGGVWWGGGTEPENCIACSVISLPPGSHSVSLTSSHWPGSSLPPVALLCVFVLPLLLALSSFLFLCHYITLSLLSILSSLCLLPSTFSAVISTASPLYLCLSPPSLSLPLCSSLCADLALASICALSPELEKCKMPTNLQVNSSNLKK